MAGTSSSRLAGGCGTGSKSSDPAVQLHWLFTGPLGHVFPPQCFPGSGEMCMGGICLCGAGKSGSMLQERPLQGVCTVRMKSPAAGKALARFFLHCDAETCWLSAIIQCNLPLSCCRPAALRHQVRQHPAGLEQLR